MNEQEATDSEHRDWRLWEGLVSAYGAYYGARMAFHQQAADEVAVLRRALRDNVASSLALEMAAFLPVESLVVLLPELLDRCLSHRDVWRARPLIGTLPRAWLLERIERLVEPYLVEGDDEEYRRFLELYATLDSALTARLARRALAHNNPHVREAGADFLDADADTNPPGQWRS